MNERTKRRKRRRAKARLRDPRAVRSHRRKTGRTGAIQRKRTPSRARVEWGSTEPTSPPFSLLF